MISLNQLPVGKTAYIKYLKTSKCIHKRLLDIGFVPGEKVCCLFESIARDPRAYLIKNTVIALRSEDAQTIIVREGE